MAACTSGSSPPDLVFDADTSSSGEADGTSGASDGTVTGTGPSTDSDPSTSSAATTSTPSTTEPTGEETSSSTGAAECFDCECYEEVGDPVVVSCNNQLNPTGAGQHLWGSSYINWASQSGGVVFEQRLRILQPALASFHTQQFTLSDASGGYIGLQATTIADDGSIATHARFSIWDTLAADSGNCMTFGGEGIGFTCVIDPFPIEMGTFYTLRIERGETEVDGTWWEGSVTHDVDCERRVIGRIKVPHAAQQRFIRSFVNFSEYFGASAADCQSVPQSVAEWTAPRLTDEAGETVTDVFSSFTKAEPGEPCSEAGVEASGEILSVGEMTVYRMTNGSIQMCQ